MSGLYIFDLDGTLALIDHRRHLVSEKSNGADWSAFESLCTKDTPNLPVCTILKDLRNAGGEILIFSGRSEEVRDLTVYWLVKHGIFKLSELGDGVLTMRPRGDNTPDHILKKSWLDNMLDVDRNRLVAIFDDRSSVVKMWRGEGITCCQVAPGSF